MQNTSFKEISYEKHSEFYKEQNPDALLKKHKTFFDVKTVDLWRHTRQLELIKLYCGLYKNSEWLTVGDVIVVLGMTAIVMIPKRAYSFDL